MYAQDSVQYFLVTGDGVLLQATVGKKRFPLLDRRNEDDLCQHSIRTLDFNHDGYDDLLMEVTACGGNCCGNQYFFFTYDGQTFQKTDVVGYDWNGVEVNVDSVGGPYVIIDDFPSGIDNTTICENKTTTYRLDGISWEVVKQKNEVKVKSEIELLSSQFDQKFQKKSITFDLDEDGGLDSVSCYYGSRWGALTLCEINFSNGNRLELNQGPKRIGVLKTSTNGFHDLVFDCEEIVTWNGELYE